MSHASGLPVKTIVNLTSPDQKFQLLKPSVGAVLKILALEIELPEQLMKLANAIFETPLAPEIRQVPSKFVENHTVAAFVIRPITIFNRTSLKALRDCIGYFADPMVQTVVPNIDHLAVYRIGRRIQRAYDCSADVTGVNQRSPWAAITTHPNASTRPGQPA
jgi:hypothetical protein